MRYLKSNRLYCFSPPVMLATFIIEIACAVWVLFRYKLTPVTRIAAAILVCLAVFQLAEYNVCEGAWGVNSLMWARIGYVAITLLPPLGIHLTATLAGRKPRWLLALAYGSAAVFAAIFLFVGHGIESQECLGNYVIFMIAPWASLLYGVYYYGWLLATVAYALLLARKMHMAHHRRAIRFLALGYVAFIAPVTAVNIIDPATLTGIPSIMCGFAVILALILTLLVLPGYYKK